MGLLDWITRNKNSDIRYDDPFLEYKTERVGTLEVPDKLTDLNAFSLANTVTEIFHPIDFIADRASKLRFYIADKNGIEIPNTELNRFLTNINPLYSFSDLFYQSVFSYLSDGNIYHYVQVPQSYKNVTANSITRLDILQPNLVSINEFSNLSILQVLSLNDFIKTIKYADTTYAANYLEASKLALYNYDMTRKMNSNILSKSPLFKSYRNINNLLATYSARYNVYVNNGAAGYLSKKGTTTGIESIVSGREDILKDINSRNGITGRRNLWGISSVPIEFVNTLVDIQKLMPFEETLEDSIKIAATFQIPANLVSRKDQSTFNNQLEAERAVWENTLMSIVDTTAANFTKTFRLDKIGYQIKADYSTVSALQQNQSVEEDVIKRQLENLKLLKELNPEIDITKQTESISLKYE